MSFAGDIPGLAGVGEGSGRADSTTADVREDLAIVAEAPIANAPVNIIVCADVQRGLEATIPSSIFPAVQNLLLAATALGLGSALTTITTGFRSEMQALLALPDHVRPVALVPIGHPARALGRPRRAPFNEHTYRERYGRTW